MSKACCSTCSAFGYRTCDRCGGVAFPEAVEMSPPGEELCGYCVSLAA